MEGIGVARRDRRARTPGRLRPGRQQAVAELLESSRVTVHVGSSAEVPAARKLVSIPRDASSTRAGSSRCHGSSAAHPQLTRGPRRLPSGRRAVPGAVDWSRACSPPATPRTARSSTAGSARRWPIPPRLGSRRSPGPKCRSRRSAGAARRALHRCRAAVPDGADRGRGVESEVSRDRPWPVDEKIVAEELGPLLRTLD